MYFHELRPGDMIISSAENQQSSDDYIEIVLSVEGSFLYPGGAVVKFWRVWSGTGDNCVYQGTPFCKYSYQEHDSLGPEETVFRAGEPVLGQSYPLYDRR